MSKVSRTRIASVIADKTQKSGVTIDLTREVAAYLLQERRVGELESVLRDVQADWADNGYVEVIARSAHELDAETRRDIENQVRKIFPSAKNVAVTEQIDPSVIGGVKLELPNKQLDLSVEAKLNKFKQLTEVN